MIPTTPPRSPRPDNDDGMSTVEYAIGTIAAAAFAAVLYAVVTSDDCTLSGCPPEATPCE